MTTAAAVEDKESEYRKTLEHLKQLIHKQDEDDRQRLLEIARQFEAAGTVPKDRIAARIIHDIKKALKEEIISLEGHLAYLEDRRRNMKIYVNKRLPDEYKEKEEE